jgi:hypothetical protein
MSMARRRIASIFSRGFALSAFSLWDSCMVWRSRYQWAGQFHDFDIDSGLLMVRVIGIIDYVDMVRPDGPDLRRYHGGSLTDRGSIIGRSFGFRRRIRSRLFLRYERCALGTKKGYVPLLLESLGGGNSE